MNFQKFKLLMWKNYRLRRYHGAVTAIELFVPILIGCIMVWTISKLPPSKETSKRSETIYASYLKKEYVVRGASQLDVYYAPNGRVIDQFMNRMKSMFSYMNWQKKGLASEAELENVLHNSRLEDTYGIFFQNIISDESLPDKLTYVMRSAVDWNTKILYPVEETTQPRQTDPYRDKFFCAVQWLINDHFVEYKTSKSALFEVRFEWFPFPQYTLNESPTSWLSIVFGVVIVLVILIESIPLINDIIDEKESGVKELMKITGLGEWLMWFGWFFHGFIINLVSLTILTIISMYPFNGPGTGIIRFVHFSVLWSFIILYCVANISFCFMFSAIFQRTTIASSVFLICYAGLLIGTYWLMNNAADNPALRLAALAPVGAFVLGFSRIRYYEIYSIDFTWSSVIASENERNSISFMFCLLMLVFDTCLYFCLAYYITAINPGKFGARKSPFFIFEGLFSRFFTKDTQPLENLDDEADSEFFEAPPQNVEATIQIKDLHKHFGKVYAVRGVDMNIYEGEMTALLGHNGAGKTTTMSIMTGLSSPSAGSIHFRGMDIFENMDEFRQNLGMCPQENRIMPYLTVVEHLLFFGQLKGVSRTDALAEADEYLYMMEMQEKKNSLVNALSGGMKRKLCLAIALMGEAEVLILDEPTSGMDVQSRRQLWDFLLDLRGHRTVIFTTHHMEEADALGDRIAIMNHGIIVCHGTPMFLKKAYGTGYELTITKQGGNSAAIDNVVKTALPSASLELETATKTVYKLPLTETSEFPTLFRSLEAEKLRLGIGNLGLAATTMEHVFLKVGGISIYGAESTKYKKVTDSYYGTNSLHYVEGASLYVQQIKAIFKKKFLYTSRNSFSIFIRIILPSLFIMFVMYALNQDLSPQPPLDLSMSTYPGSTVVLKNNVPDSSFAKHLPAYVAEKGGLLVDARISPIEKDLLQYGSDISKYNKQYISAFEVNSSTMKVLNNPPLLHSFPITITTYTNVLLRSITNDSRYQINTIIHPLQIKLESHVDTETGERKTKKVCASQPNVITFYAIWFFALAFYTLDLMALFAEFVNMERIDGFQHIQTMSSVSPLVYWFATLLSDLTFVLLVTFLRVGIFKIVDHSSFLGLDMSLGVFAVTIILYGISALLFIYVTNNSSDSKEESYTSFFLFNFIYCMMTIIVYAASTAEYNSKILNYVIKVVSRIVLLVPSYNFLILFIKLMLIFRANSVCSYCSGAAKAICENESIKNPYFVFESEQNKIGILLETLFLIFGIILYTVILSLVNTGFVHYWLNSLKNGLFGTDSTNSAEGDDDVIQEYEEVQKYKQDESSIVEGNQISLLVDGLRKNYINWFKPFTAVSDVNFVVKHGECFGLLGVNGAGKSTTFKMLTAEIVPTLGDASIENVKLSANKMQYLSMAGYCPQTNCFIEVMTGREMLSMIATMRGVFRNEIKLLVDKWIEIIGLGEFQYRKCGTYSGGNKRKLCTAMSLIGDPRVVFLDEPTTGVDPVSRRNLYDIMGQSKELGQAVILTSHRRCFIIK
ncbi:phospholipid-transporting ATPase ABCA3-like isoform X2 [Planococcus citri]|uniref:phospholipid-transporting ATPase ABCA3-like isoform X2 n=1 Tax=Planococcus citri TaxID=170843 RepID=UPI0031F72485